MALIEYNLVFGTPKDVVIAEAIVVNLYQTLTAQPETGAFRWLF